MKLPSPHPGWGGWAARSMCSNSGEFDTKWDGPCSCHMGVLFEAPLVFLARPHALAMKCPAAAQAITWQGHQHMTLLLVCYDTGELSKVPLARLQAAVGDDDAQWLHRLSHGIDSEAVKQRMLPKGVGCSKTFRGRNALSTLPEVHKWLKELAGELEVGVLCSWAGGGSDLQGSGSGQLVVDVAELLFACASVACCQRTSAAGRHVGATISDPLHACVLCPNPKS